ncbi:MAG: hypothetical protein Q8P81_04085, partial [Nanoarchaeota archaeon]|nr:hypothetical protein [Nanoarchaeota archaeon]
MGKNNMCLKEKELVVMFGLLFSLVLVLQFGFVSSQSFQSSFVAQSSGQNFGGLGSSLSNQEMCRVGQDFMLQISPTGCTPSVVRSDLLEKQNVPVFCPIAAIQVNPLIDVSSIKSVQVTGQTPQEVSGVGFQPANAALGFSSEITNKPVLENIGYAVIVLRQQRNESAMPDFVEGNLTARIKYDVDNAFGAGRMSFYLPVLTDEEWSQEFNKHSFWNGKGYLRAESVEGDRATIAVYSGDDIGSRGEIRRRSASQNLNVGQTSSDISVSGFAYCAASLNVRLDGIESKDTTARLMINGDSLEVKEGERFLENRCVVRNLEKKGVLEKVTLSCNEDGRQSNFNLMFSPKIKIDIEGVNMTVGVGDKIGVNADGDKGIYLAYVGTVGDTSQEKDLAVGFVAVPGPGERLGDDELESLSDFFDDIPDGFDRGVLETLREADPSFVGVAKALAGRISTNVLNVYNWIVDGTNFDFVRLSDEEVVVFGTSMTVIGFADPVDVDVSTFDRILRESYQNSVRDYESVIDSYSSDEYPEGSESLGEQAMKGLIELHSGVGQKRTVVSLCNEFKDNYPNSENVPDICESAVRLASSDIDTRDVEIQGRTYRISLDRISEPGFEEFGAVVSVRMPDGNITRFDLRKESVIILNDATGAYIQLLDLETGPSGSSARIRTNLREGVLEMAAGVIAGDSVINVRESFPSSRGGHLINLEKVNLVKVAKVSVISNVKDTGTVADFPFKIGIEKRFVQLSPEKTRERIESLNETIEKWQSINSKLGTAVEFGNKACLGVGAGLTLKNFLSNLG